MSVQYQIDDLGFALGKQAGTEIFEGRVELTAQVDAVGAVLTLAPVTLSEDVDRWLDVCEYFLLALGKS